QHSKQLLDGADLQQQHLRGAVAKAVGVDVLTTAISPAMLQTIASDTLVNGAPSAEWWARQAGATQRRFQDQVRLGLLQGESVDDISRRVRGTKAANFADGIMTASARDA